MSSMMILLERELLLASCRLAERLLPPRTTDAARAHVLLRAEGAGLQLHAMGPEAALRLDLAAEVEQVGDVLLPVRQALAILRQSDAEVLRLESAPGRLSLLGEGARFDLVVPEPTRLSPVEPFPDSPCLHIEAEPLGRALRRTLFACGEPSNRYAFHAVQWEGQGTEVRIATTDSLRLAVAEVPAQTQGEELLPFRRLLPRVSLELLAKVCAGRDGPVEVALGETHASFRAGSAVVQGWYVRGEFPDWRKVFPGKPRSLVPAAVGPLLSAARQAAAIRGELTEKVLVRFEPGRVLLESRSEGEGRARVRRPLPLSGAVVEVALRSGDLVELLEALGPEEAVVFGVSGPEAPVLALTSDGYRHALMPLRPA